MAKFMLAYKGPATRPEDMSEDARNEEMQRWMEWMGALGDRLLEAGSPFGASVSVRGDGSTGAADDLTGYTVVEADDVDGAAAACKDHPYLREGTDTFSIEVFELIEMG